MRDSSEQDVDKNFELTLKEASEVEFWRSEYIKRLFYSDSNYYSKLLSGYTSLQKKWNFFAEKNDLPPSEREFNLRNFLYGFGRDIGWASSFLVSDTNKLYIHFSTEYDTVNIGHSIHEACSIFGFYFDDLICRTDMSELLKEEEIIIPQPPDRYWYKGHYHPTFAQDVLTFMTQDPNTPTMINYIGDEWVRSYREFENSPHNVYLPPGANLFSMDFVITGKSIHQDFDLDSRPLEISNTMKYIAIYVKMLYRFQQ